MTKFITTNYGLSDYALDPENESYVQCVSDRIVKRERDGRVQNVECDRDNEYAYVSVLDQMDAEQRYTTADTYDDQDKWVWVGGQQMTVVALDATYALGDQALNAWRDSNGNLRCGSVEIRYFADGTPVARCVRCKARLTYAQPTPPFSLRHAMEEFTMAVVRHGHNHQSKGYWVNVPETYHTQPMFRVDSEGVTDVLVKRVVEPAHKEFIARPLTPIGKPKM